MGKPQDSSRTQGGSDKLPVDHNYGKKMAQLFKASLA